MTVKSTSDAAGSTALAKPQTDGRRQRSLRSREKILKAMWELMLAGDMEPSAADIAERAGVGLRSVFRHFEDLDTLNRELVLLAESEITPLFMRPFKSTEWKGQLIELIDRSSELWERIMVPHTAGEIRRFKSDVLMADYRSSRMKELSWVKAVLPEDVPNYEWVLLSLDIALSFSTVRRLRQDRKLSLEETKDTMRFMVQSIIDAAA